MNFSTMAFLADDNVTAIKGKFGTPNSRAYEDYDGKEYTYKTTRKDIKVGDLVVVQCVGPSAAWGFGIIKVTEIDADIDLDANWEYKWVLTRIDKEELEETIYAEKKLIKQMRKEQLKHKKQKFREASGFGDIDMPKLSDFTNGGFEAVTEEETK